MSASKTKRLSERISIRCTKKEKERFDLFVKQKGTSQRECFMECIQESMKTARKDNKEKKQIVKCVCIIQNVVNELEDPKLENKIREELRELWEIL